jgi:NTE family protein
MKWALVLSGGGARGLAHIGVLKILKLWGLRPDIVVGTSMGAIVGGAFACGMEPEEMEKFMVEEFDLHKYLDSWIMKLEDGPFVKIIKAGDAFQSLLRSTAVDSGRKALKLFRKFTNNRRFSETEIPFACNAVDLLSGKEIILNEGRVAEAVRASMSLPAVFDPVDYREMLLVDGGLANNAPVWIAKKMGARRVLRIMVSKFENAPKQEMKNGFDIFLRSTEITANTLRECNRDNRSVLEVLAYDGTEILDFGRNKELIRLGEQAMLAREREVIRWFGRKRFWLPVSSPNQAGK